MKYNNYKFLYPPRPEAAIPPVDLAKYTTGEFAAQPKLNGDCVVIATNGKTLLELGIDGMSYDISQRFIIRNRHNEPKHRVESFIDFTGLHKCDGWVVFAGELLDKSKRGEDGEILKGFVIWDVLVWDSRYLLGSTFRERVDLIENIFPPITLQVNPAGQMKEFKHLILTDVSGVMRVPTYLDAFAALYNDLILTDIYEGVVLKKLEGRLELGLREKNNCSWQIKCRKVTKLYKF